MRRDAQGFYVPTDEEKARIRLLYEQTGNVRRIAAMLEISWPAARDLLVRLGLRERHLTRSEQRGATHAIVVLRSPERRRLPTRDDAGLGRVPDPIEWAWLAGVFDAIGRTSWDHKARRVTLSSTDLDLMHRVRDTLDAGTVSVLKRATISYQWALGRRVALRQLGEGILSFSRTKRRVWQGLLNDLDEIDAQLAGRQEQEAR